jgi:hypothetical protein
MAATYTDHRLSAPVLPNIRHHVHNVFAGEMLCQTTLNQIQTYLERTVPGSRWRVNIGYENYDLALSVRFDTEQHITFYRIKWS